MTGRKLLRPNRAYAVTCPQCGKRGYSSRRSAKRAARYIAPDEPTRAYQCGVLWHWGHLPKNVRDGRIAASEIYGEDE